MTEQIKINIGANASQAIAEMGKVRSAAGGLKETFGGVRMGLGLVTAFSGVNLIREFMEPVKQGFMEVTQSSADFNAIVQMVTEGLVELGRALGAVVIPVIEAFAEVLARIVEFFGGRFAGLAFRAGFAELRAGPPLLTGRQFTSPASDQYADKMARNSDRQTAYLASLNAALGNLQRDLAMSDLFDPW